MSYVLSVIHPPVPPAAFGQAVRPTQQPSASEAHTARMVVHTYARLTANRMDLGDAREIARSLLDAPGRGIRHQPSGLTFRIDPGDDAPHPCPCCNRLVLITDHACAAADDAYCLGCFTWNRNVPACLPANTAHTEEDTPS